MDWIKRNKFFVAGAVVAFALMGAAGYYLYSQMQANAEIKEKLDADYQELNRLNQEKPHPGSGSVDNIEVARKQQQQINTQAQKLRGHFQPVPAIPDSTNVTSQEFTAALRMTIDELQRAATNASVALPAADAAAGNQSYSFSFTAHRNRVTFAPGTLQGMAVQLGEVKAITSILIKAGVNAIDGIRRERISPDDSSGPPTDYHLKKSTTNEMAVVVPYEITFRSFSTELAGVLSGFGASQHGFLIKTINVEPTTGTSTDTPGQIPMMPGYMQAAPVPGVPAAEASSRAAMARRYGLPGGGPMGRGGGGGPEGLGMVGGGTLGVAGGGTLGGAAGGASYQGGVPGMPPTPQMNVTPVPGAYGTQPGAAARGGLQTVLDEKQVKVTIGLDLIKLLPPK